MTTTTEQPYTNGVDVSTLLATREAVRGNPEIAKFQFRAANLWVKGTHSVSTYDGFHGVGQEMAHRQRTEVVSDHPEVLVGTDHGPTPVEYLLHALAACVTTSLVYSAAARRVKLTMVESTLEGDLNVEGAMGTNTVDFRNGFERIRMSIRIAGDAPAEKLREVVQRGTDRSVVFDSITKGVPVSVDVDTV